MAGGRVDDGGDTAVPAGEDEGDGVEKRPVGEAQRWMLASVDASLRGVT